MVEILLREQQKYYDFYDSVKETLYRTVERTVNIYENAVEGDGYGVTAFLKCTATLFFGAIFLVALKIYISFRHFNYAAFMILYYWGRLYFGSGEHLRNAHRDRTLHDDD